VLIWKGIKKNLEILKFVENYQRFLRKITTDFAD